MTRMSMRIRLCVTFGGWLLASSVAGQAKVVTEEPKEEVAADPVAAAEQALLDVGKKFKRRPLALTRLGKAAHRKDKRREAEALSTDVMDAIGKLARAQAAVCTAMQPGPENAQANSALGDLLAALGGQMELLVTETIAPLWSQLPMMALRAGKFDFGAVHARLYSALRDHRDALAACKGKLHGAGKKASQTARVELVKPYEAAFEAAVLHALSEHKRWARVEQDLDLALRGFARDRRAAVEERLRSALRQRIK